MSAIKHKEVFKLSNKRIYPDNIKVYVSNPNIKKLIEALAKKERRSTSQMGEILFEEALEARGIKVNDPQPTS